MTPLYLPSLGQSSPNCPMIPIEVLTVAIQHVIPVIDIFIEGYELSRPQGMKRRISNSWQIMRKMFRSQRISNLSSAVDIKSHTCDPPDGGSYWIMKLTFATKIKCTVLLVIQLLIHRLLNNKKCHSRNGSITSPNFHDAICWEWEKKSVGSVSSFVNIYILLIKPCVVILSKQAGMHIKAPKLYHKNLI